MNEKHPRISFGIIVLNGEPLTRACVLHVYKHAHEILVCEGAVQRAAAFAGATGRSVDGTCESLNFILENCDPEDKIRVVARDGLWEDKNEQTNAYLANMTGDYLWQVDIDEFYRDSDVETVRELLKNSPDIQSVSFRWKNLWGDGCYEMQGPYLDHIGGVVTRVMKWVEGGTYKGVSDRVRIEASDGTSTLDGRSISGYDLAEELGIYCYHYSLVFLDQVNQKSAYYRNPGADPTFDHSKGLEWFSNSWLTLNQPFRVHNRYLQPSWLIPFNGDHPPGIGSLIEGARSPDGQRVVRDCKDASRIVFSLRYKAKRYILKLITDWRMKKIKSHWGYYIDQGVDAWIDGGVCSALGRSMRFLTRALMNRAWK